MPTRRAVAFYLCAVLFLAIDATRVVANTSEVLDRIQSKQITDSFDYVWLAAFLLTGFMMVIVGMASLFPVRRSAVWPVTLWVALLVELAMGLILFTLIGDRRSVVLILLGYPFLLVPAAIYVWSWLGVFEDQML